MQQINIVISGFTPYEGIARSLDPEHAKEEAKARMHAVFAEAFSQMHSR